MNTCVSRSRQAVVYYDRWMDPCFSVLLDKELKHIHASNNQEMLMLGLMVSAFKNVCF